MIWRCVKLTLTLTSWLVESLLLRALAQTPAIAELSNGTYQLCSQPAPEAWQQGEAWRQGAGVCLMGIKQNDSFDGYYGYPHSDAFVCLRGIMNGLKFTGQGYLISWESHRWEVLPVQPFFWDTEERLQLDQGRLVRSSTASQSVDWIVFQSATLDFQSFYLYHEPQMTPPQQLCDWNFER